ncbi:MAG: Ig domain-containing protein [Clostridiales bacterium]|nr:Ig domain-containing protein [Clostridiales bacterium]
MKKTTKKLLSVGLTLALAASIGGGLVACGGNDNDGKDKKPAGVPYWVAGTIKGVAEWDNVTATNRFSKTEDANIFTITLDMWEEDTFKIRYEGKSWGDFQLNYDNSYDADQKADPDAKIIDGGGISGEHNYGVGEEGNYTLKLDISGATPVLSYVYNGEATDKAPKPVTGITLNKPTLTLEEGATEQLTATVAPSNADNPAVTWSSSDEAVATVSATGLVTAVAAGTATITVTSVADSTKKATCALTVAEAGTIIDVESITLNKTATTLHVGGEETLVATVAPDNATNKTVAYTSSAETIATVDATGKITALKPGTATITAQAGEETAECEVTVAPDYYLIGSLNGWSTVDTLGQSGVIYLTEDAETAGVYHTTSVEISKGTEFQIAVVANGWTGAVKNSALPTDAAEGDDTLTYFEAQGTDNIKAKTSGMYTITIDLTGENPVFSAVQDDNLPDNITEATNLQAYGDATEWTWSDVEGVERPAVDFTQDEETGKWTATLTDVALVAGELQLRWGTNFTATVYCDYGMGEVFTAPDGAIEKAATSNNIKVNTAGTYNITVTLTAEGDVESVVLVAA